MNFEKLDPIQAKVLDWAKEKGIFAKATSETQTTKLLEEANELLKAIKNEPLQNQILELGDVLVVLTILCKQLGTDFYNCSPVFRKKEHDIEKNATILVSSVGFIMHSVKYRNVFDTERLIAKYLNIVDNVCRQLKTTPHQALQAAYDKIKNRTGKMINGTFVKD